MVDHRRNLLSVKYFGISLLSTVIFLSLGNPAFAQKKRQTKQELMESIKPNYDVLENDPEKLPNLTYGFELGSSVGQEWTFGAGASIFYRMPNFGEFNLKAFTAANVWYDSYNYYNELQPRYSANEVELNFTRYYKQNKKEIITRFTLKGLGTVGNTSYYLVGWFPEPKTIDVGWRVGLSNRVGAGYFARDPKTFNQVTVRDYSQFSVFAGWASTSRRTLSVDYQGVGIIFDHGMRQRYFDVFLAPFQHANAFDETGQFSDSTGFYYTYQPVQLAKIPFGFRAGFTMYKPWGQRARVARTTSLEFGYRPTFGEFSNGIFFNVRWGFSICGKRSIGKTESNYDYEPETIDDYRNREKAYRRPSPAPKGATQPKKQPTKAPVPDEPPVDKRKTGRKANDEDSPLKQPVKKIPSYRKDGFGK